MNKKKYILCCLSKTIFKNILKLNKTLSNKFRIKENKNLYIISGKIEIHFFK